MIRASNDDSGAFLRQLSSGAGGGRGGWDYCSYYEKNGSTSSLRLSGRGGGGVWWSMLEEGEPMVPAKKRVMVVVDHGVRAKQAMMWALTHVANKGDLLILLHVIPTATGRGGSGDAPRLADTLGALCKECRPEVEVEALVIQGPKLTSVLNQVQQQEASVLVLAQGKPSLFCCLFRSKSEDFVDDCINKAGCLTLAVRKQSKGIGGYLVSTRWQKNFWLLA